MSIIHNLDSISPKTMAESVINAINADTNDELSAIGGGSGGNADDTPVLILGADHPNIQQYGTNNNGLSKMYADFGIQHYIAINTDYDGSPGLVDQYTWEQQDRMVRENGVEIVSHAARHVNDWDGCSTGIGIKYVGAGSAATVAITGTYPAVTITGTVTGDASSNFSFLLTDTAYNTIEKLLAAIVAVNGGGKWDAVSAPELDTSIRSNLLLTVAAKSVKNYVGPSTGKSLYCPFSCGGGIFVRYTGYTYETAQVSVSATALTLFGDGNLLYQVALSTVTLSQLVTAINAVTGFAAEVCNDNISTDDNYTTGAESASNLIATSAQDCMTQKSILTAGVPWWQMVDWQLSRAKLVAANNGVDLVAFAQSGGNFHKHTTFGHRQHIAWRGNTDDRPIISPLPQTLDSIDNYVLQFSANGGYTQAQKEAALLALADSKGFLSSWLIHDALPDGTTGYKLDIGGVYTAPNWQTATVYAIGNRVKNSNKVYSCTTAHTSGATFAGDLATKWTLIFTPDSNESEIFYLLGVMRSLQLQGKLRIAKLEDVPTLSKQGPTNLVFNPNFINSGESLLGLVANGDVIPGWLLNTNANMTGISIVNGKMSVTTTGDASALARSVVTLTPGKTYEFGCLIEIDSYTSGAGCELRLAKLRGNSPYMIDTAAVITVNGAITKTEHVRFRFTVPPLDIQYPRIKSKAGPFNLSTNKNIRLNILGLGQIDIDCSVGAAVLTAVTSVEVAAAINAGIIASATYATRGEYHNIARVVNNKVVLEVPRMGINNVVSLLVSEGTTLGASNIIFGGISGSSIAYAIPNAQSIDSNHPFYFYFYQNMIGSARYSNPYVSEVEYL